MNDYNYGAQKTFENLKAIEAGLFGAERAGGAARAPAGEERARDTWRLNQEVLDARRECAALKEELKAARIMITEQNVLATTSRSALREMFRDAEDMKSEAARRQHEISGLRSEIDRLKSEVTVEKLRNADLGKKLEQEAVLRADMENLLLESARREETRRREIETRARDLITSSSAAPERFQPFNRARK